MANNAKLILLTSSLGRVVRIDRECTFSKVKLNA